MICGHCGHENASEVETCEGCEASPLLDGRYRLESIVGRGAAGITYRAVALQDGAVVAVKELPFRKIDDLKVKELFEREASTLKQLHHPGIPKYVDDFTFGSGKNLSLFLVQEFIDGPNLEDELERWRYTEHEVLDVMRELAGILGYLHGLSPPVVHRDVKPKNVLSRPDGPLALVDFGSVRAAIEDPAMGGSTIAGTYGYMAPEQFRGDASVQSDLYRLGALAIRLLTRKQPTEFIDYSGRIAAWRPHANVSAHTAALLDALLEIDPDRRPSTVDVIDRIDQIRTAPRAKAQLPAPPPWVPTREPRTLEERFEAKSYEALKTVDKQLPTTTFEPKPVQLRRDIGIGVGLILAPLGFCLFLVLVFSDREDAPVEPVPVKPVPVEPPRPAVARGLLRGLEFGMAEAAAKATLPELASAGAISTESLAFHGCETPKRPMSFLSMAKNEVGAEYEVDATLRRLDAECKLSFIESKLEKIACTMSFDSLSAHLLAERDLLASLEKHYGPAHDRSSDPFDNMPNSGPIKHHGWWAWADPQARLELNSDIKWLLDPIGTESTIEVTNVSAAYGRILQQTPEAEVTVLCARKREAVPQGRAEEQADLERIRGGDCSRVTGRATFASKPMGVTVFIDGKKIGTTPINSYKLPSNCPIKVRFVAPDGRAKNVMIKLHPNMTSVYSVAFK